MATFWTGFRVNDQVEVTVNGYCTQSYCNHRVVRKGKPTPGIFFPADAHIRARTIPLVSGMALCWLCQTNFPRCDIDPDPKKEFSP